MAKHKLPAKRPMDSEEARTWASWALSYHEGTEIGAHMTVLNALACGIQLQKAKAALPHGQFLKWQTKYFGKSMTRRTCTNYMNLADRLSKLPGGKWETVSHLLDVNPVDFTPQYAAKIMPKISKLVEGKTVRRLYEDLGIIKPRASKNDKLPPRTGDYDQDEKAKGHVWVNDCINHLSGASVFKDYLHDEDLTALIRAMLHAAAELGVPLREPGTKKRTANHANDANGKEALHGKAHPFHASTEGGEHYYHMSVDDRMDVVKRMDRKKCEAALTLPHLQKTVRTAVERRLKKLKKAEGK